MSNYHQRILEGRKQFLRLVMEQEKELLSIYEEAAKQVAYKLSKANPGGLTARYLSELEKTINQYISELRNNLTETIKDGIEASSQIASAVQLGYLNSIAPREDILATFNKMFTQLPNGIVKQLINGSYYADGKTLNNRIWDLTSKNASDIDRLIKINVAKGVNARELAKQLDAYINPTKKIDAKTLEAGMNKNISYQAQRLSRTSLTHASTETYIQGAKMNPFNKGLKWNLSPSHYERQVKKWGQDICDEYAGQIFKPEKVPIQHPNCLCYLTQENIDTEKARDELIAWLNGESNSKLDNWLENYGEEFGITKANDDIDSQKQSKVSPANKNGEKIKFDLGNMKDDKQQEVISIITGLSSKYDTLLEKVSMGNSKTGVIFSSSDNTMYILGSNNSNIIHEFAHSIAVTDNDKDGLTDNKDFWKEIKKVRNEYEKECKINPDVSISVYSHSKSKTGSMLDEFMAEAFTHAILKDKKYLLNNYGNNFKYSDKVLEIVDKYFKKK